MTKLGLFTAAAALIALSPLAMAQSSNSVSSNGGSFTLAQMQGQSQPQQPQRMQQTQQAQMVAPMHEEMAPEAVKWDAGDKRTWQDENNQVPKGE